jgi:hypothetical protein
MQAEERKPSGSKSELLRFIRVNNASVYGRSDYLGKVFPDVSMEERKSALHVPCMTGLDEGKGCPASTYVLGRDIQTTSSCWWAYSWKHVSSAP